MPDLDPNLAIVRRDDQDRAIVRPLEADAPGPQQAVAVILDRIAFEIGDGRDDKLAVVIALQCFKLLLERRLLLRRQHVRRIDDQPGELGESLCASRRRCCEQQRQRAPHHTERHRSKLLVRGIQLALPKSTLGAVSASGVVAWNGTIALAP